jgi:hypothetical protein
VLFYFHVSDQNFVRICCLIRARYIPRPSHHCFDHPNIWRRTQIMALFSMQCSVVSWHSVFRMSKCSPQPAPILKHHCFEFFLKVRDEVFHPSKITRKIIVFK